MLRKGSNSGSDSFDRYSTMRVMQKLKDNSSNENSMDSSTSGAVQRLENLSINSNDLSASDEEVIQKKIISFPAPIVTDTDLESHEMTYINHIGEGSFGTVFKASYKSQMVAVKQITYANQDEEKDDHQQESDNLNQCFHEKTIHGMLSRSSNSQQYIIKLYGFMLDATKKDFYLVTEFAEESLSGLLAQKPLGLKSKYSISKKIATAIHVMHENGVVHRDIKGDNVLLVGGEVKMCDFGVATFYEPKNKAGIKCELAGTIPWAAPEVFQRVPYTEKVDIYSFGVLLWEITTQTDPRDLDEFARLHPDRQFYLACMGKLPNLPISENIPIPLLSKMKRCWELEPSNRPDAGELAKELEKDFSSLKM